MKKIYFLLSGFILTFLASAQSVKLNTDFPAADKPLTLTVNVEGTSLEGYADNVWIWTWIDNAQGDADAPTNVNPATSPGQDAALMTRTATNPDEYTITFTPTVFFNKPASELQRIGFKLKSRDWNDNKQSDQDLFIDMYQGGFQAKLLSPRQNNHLMKVNEILNISVVTSSAADQIELFFDNTSTHITSNTDTLDYAFTAANGGTVSAKIIASKAGETDAILEFIITVIQPTVEEARPAGVKDGINYIDDQTVILSLLAPGKDFVFVLGEFNNWQTNSSYQMKKDGERFWLEISGLTKGVEYAFQYFVDGEVKIADPFSDKVLDPDDQYIPANSYPNPKAFPEGANSGEWYEKRASVIQTGQTPFEWEIQDFAEPKKEELVIYELLIRDFFASDQRNYSNLIDTLSYLKKLGVNAIELMPVTEFNGNDSWGYNPTFMFAVDKAYGTKQMLKQFIDEAHKQGFAVILDIVLNHQDIPNPYVLMYWDGSAPTADNPWFNRVAKHPFNVFFDMNHESSYTKDYADTVAHYWLNEYKFDGLRFDLSKGFTQQDNLNNQAAWDAYDESRINILKRIATEVFSYKPEAYLILEHFGSDEEEKELSEAGMMLWGNMHGSYKDAAIGNDSNFSKGYFKSRSWTNNNLITYMESHDEERLMVDALSFGQSSGSYNIKSLSTALDRMKLVSSFHLLVPGPKMIWQFGELGYDHSINTCQDGSVKNECRVAAKPVTWDYLE
ncbi:MAG TPA: alpha-amylase family glycosyl hydrolase, partial [Cytophagales bacterium]|nr:alpha-amylase family glycosyl hydrolase [Cytophagales bacterium]